MLEKKGIYGGLDSDTEDRLLKDGDYRDALNIRNSIPDGASVGAAVNMKGNTLVNFDMPGGQNTTIGTYDDVLNKRVLYFVHNENNNHTIMSYSTVTGAVTQWVKNSLLNFSLSFPILHVDVIDDLLLWTDNNNEPSAILISQALAGFYNTTVSRQYFDAICYAPGYAPEGVTYASDTTYNQNNIRRKQFQFRYAYIDSMDRVSAASPISKISVPDTEPIFFPASQYDTYQNNRIDFSVNTGYDFVKKIVIYVREGNTSNWYEAKTLDKAELSIPNDSAYGFQFYNDEAWIAVDQDYINRFFDFLPQKAKCQAQTSDNRITYSNIVEGYDNVVLDVTMEPQYHSVSEIDSSLQAYVNTLAVGSSGLSVTATVNGPMPQFNAVGALVTPLNILNEQIFTFSYTAIYGSNGVTLVNVKQTFSKSFAPGTSSFTICSYFAAQIQGSAALNKAYTVGPTTIQFATSTWLTLTGSNYRVMVDTAFTVSTPGIIPSPPSPFVTKELQASITVNQLEKTFPKAAHHKFAISYHDGPNRSDTAQISNDLDVYVEPQSSHSTDIGYVSMKLTINHTPPSWATHYQILYTGNNTKLDWLQFRCGTVSVSGDYYKIYINTLTGYNNFYNDATELVYSFTAGDRIIVITDGSGNTGGTSGVYLTEYSDIEIFKEDSDGTGQFILIPNTIPIAPETGSLIEIYTPKQSLSEQFYYEIGEVYPISGGFHRGNTQNQTNSQPAIVEFKGGDGYLRFRSGTFNSYVEDASISDFYPSKVWDRGRTNVVDAEAQQIRRPTTTYYSEPYIPETNINGLSTFFDDAFVTGDIKYGSIQKTYAEDDRIEFYYQLKTFFRIVKKSILYDAAGSQNVQISDNVLSPEQPYEGEYGIGDNPESHAAYGNARYHIDANRGLVLRLGGDGYTPISDYQMSVYFGKILQDRTNFGADYFRAWGVYDGKHKEYVLCFEQANKEVIVIDPDAAESSEETTETVSLPGVTISFSEPKNRWVSRYAYLPECIGSANTGVVSFRNGQLWVHDTNSVYNNFYGEQFSSTIQILSNLEQSAIKFYKNIFTESTHAWRLDATNPFGQATSLEYTDFEDKEGVFYAQFLRDVNSLVDVPILFGDPMRCHSMDIVLENNQTIETKIFAVNITSEPSMMTNV